MVLRKGLAGILIILTIACVAVSCSGKDTSAGGKVTIDFWHLDSNDLHYPEWEKEDRMVLRKGIAGILVILTIACVAVRANSPR